MAANQSGKYTRFSGIDPTLLKINGTQVTATATELNALDASANDVMSPSTVIDGLITYTSSVTTDPVTGVIHTKIYFDLTGAKSTTTDLDIIGNTGACHFGQITAAINGTITAGSVTCLETPATGVTDIDFYEASVATGAYDADASGLTNAGALLTKGGAWAASTAPTALTGLPTANYYLYVANGAGGTVGTYTAGKFLIELWGV